MNATTNISKEEFLNKIESAKKALDDVPHYDRRYLIDDVLLDKLFEIAYNSIPIEWIRKMMDKYKDWDFDNFCESLIETWEKENEQGDN